MNAPVDFKAIERMFQPRYEQLETRFDAELEIAWTYMNPSGTPCFNRGLLNDLRCHDHALEMSGGWFAAKGLKAGATLQGLAKAPGPR